ncbi:hypothetical protein NIES2101_28510 [Calothrix sp. HK-06]|nr:hypothetical protein NIES2101_28510 [Calothrix sp. HK-06]
MKRYMQKISLAAISLILICYVQVQAQSPNPPIFLAPPPTPDIGEPGKRSAAGSRGCGQDVNKPVSSQKQLIALLPIYPKSEQVFAITIAERPDFWFYIPYSSSFTYGEFVLEDESQNQTIYKTSLTEAPGIVNLRLPFSAAPLQIGKQYHWYFNIYSKKNNQIVADVEGYVKRAPLYSSLKTQLEKATPSQQVTLYGANGIWYEALSVASQLRHTQPQNTSWTALLQSVGLKDITNEPKVECCKLEIQ